MCPALARRCALKKMKSLPRIKRSAMWRSVIWPRLKERDEKVAAVEHADRERQMRLAVQGPGSVQPGAPAVYQIITTNLNNQPVQAHVSVQVSDGGAKIGEPLEANLGADGTYRVSLPADLPLKPNSHPVLVVSAKSEIGTQTEVQEQLDLVSSVYLTHLITDKPMYQPGDTVYFRSLTLDRTSLKPADQDLRLSYTITTPLGEVRQVAQGSNGLRKQIDAFSFEDIKGPDGKPVKGVGAGSYRLDPSLPGGEYTLTVREEGNRFSEQQRKFIINKYQKPRLNKELDFSRKTYGPGDEVQAAIKVTSNDGTPLKGQVVEAAVTIDGKQYDANGQVSNRTGRFPLEMDGETARTTVRFKLPAEMDKGQGNLNLTFQDGANVETLSRSIPIVLKKLNVEFFPEGGDLVAGVPNRVYFTVRTTLGMPADLKGHLREDRGWLPEDAKSNIEVATLTDDKEPGVNQGMGCFEFTPKADAKYELHIDSPEGIASKHFLPTVKADGVVLSVPEVVVGSSGAIKVTVRSTKERVLLVGAYCRGGLLDLVKLQKGQTEATLKSDTAQGGVCRITVFEELFTGANRRELKPVAERLIFKEPKEKLNIALSANQTSYVPGQRPTVTIKTTDENEASAPAIVMVAVVDKSVITLADEKTARTMPTHFLLTTEVRHPEDLEYADFLLGPQAKAKQALDLLLGTQGWRRFAEQDPAKFRQQHKDEAERLLVSIGQSGPHEATDFTLKKVEKIDAEYRAKETALSEEGDNAREQANEAAAAAPFLAARQKLDNYNDRWNKFSKWALPVICVILMIVVAVRLALGLSGVLSRAHPYYSTAAVVAALLLVGVQIWVVNKGDQATATREVAMAAEAAREMKMAEPHLEVQKKMREEKVGQDRVQLWAAEVHGDKAKNDLPLPAMAMPPQAGAAMTGAAMPPAPGAAIPEAAWRRKPRAMVWSRIG